MGTKWTEVVSVPCERGAWSAGRSALCGLFSTQEAGVALGGEEVCEQPGKRLKSDYEVRVSLWTRTFPFLVL